MNDARKNHRASGPDVEPDRATEAFTVRVTPDLKRRIEELAARDFRSLNQQAAYLLNRGIEADDNVAA